MTCQVSVCDACGLRVHIHPDHTGRRITLAYGQHHACDYPPHFARHLVAGAVHYGPDDNGQCWLEHAAICPAGGRPGHPLLATLWDEAARTAARRT